MGKLYEKWYVRNRHVARYVSEGWWGGIAVYVSNRKIDPNTALR
jgi:hypothetical protein